MIRGLGSRVSRRTAALIGFETLVIVSAVVLGAWVRLGPEAWALLQPGLGFPKALLIAMVCQVCLYYADLYDYRTMVDHREMFMRIVQALAATSFLLSAVYYWAPSLIIGRGVFVLSTILVLALVTGWRLAYEWLGSQVSPRERLLLVGTSPAAIRIARELYEHRHKLGVEIVGFVDTDPSKVGTPILNPGVIGTLDDVPAIVRARSVDRVVVSLADQRGKLPMNKLLEMKLSGVAFDHLATLYEEYLGKIAVENLRPSWLIFSSGFRKSSALTGAKRTMDVAAAVVGLVIGLPLMIVIAALVKATSRGPIFYHQRRVGLHGRIFTVHKFRSMRADAEAGTGAVWAGPHDTRMTPVGRFLRRTRLDELPQLWNILRGEMSLVGPRPERPEFVEQLTREIPFYGERHVIRPGLTGWAQIRYTYAASVEDATEKLQYDLFYVKNLSIALDLFIILATVKTVILQRGAN
jgi:sugar transferase (PEP-CTERM system associated)